MILFDLTNSEGHPEYQTLAISNGDRQFQFLESVIKAAVATGQLFLSQAILRALNYHAIACLHTNPGEIRPCNVMVGEEGHPDTYYAPAHFRVGALMDNFVNHVNSVWHHTDADILAAYVLWRLCHIHPFINGNGRTARAAAYFVICVRSGGLLPGEVNLTKFLKDHPGYTAALKHADATHAAGSLDIGPVVQVIRESIVQQLSTAPPPVEEVVVSDSEASA